MRSLSDALEVCERKKPYRNRRIARLRMQSLITNQRQDRKGLCVYRCPVGEHFHVGHKPVSWYKHKRNKEL